MLIYPVNPVNPVKHFPGYPNRPSQMPRYPNRGRLRPSGGRDFASNIGDADKC
jgi:hypothetical protein